MLASCCCGKILQENDSGGGEGEVNFGCGVLVRGHTGPITTGLWQSRSLWWEHSLGAGEGGGRSSTRQPQWKLEGRGGGWEWGAATTAIT